MTKNDRINNQIHTEIIQSMLNSLYELMVDISSLIINGESIKALEKIKTTENLVNELKQKKDPILDNELIEITNDLDKLTNSIGGKLRNFKRSSTDNQIIRGKDSNSKIMDFTKSKRIIFSQRDHTSIQLNSNFLRIFLIPYVEALEEIQKVMNLIIGNFLQCVKIRSISQYSPVNVDFSGIKEAIEFVMNHVIPWRKKHAKKMAKLRSEERELENQRRAIENDEMVIKFGLTLEEIEEKKVGIELRKEELRKQQIENERNKFAFEKEKVTFLFETLEKMYPNLTPEEKMEHVAKLLPSFSTILESDLEIHYLPEKSK